MAQGYDCYSPVSAAVAKAMVANGRTFVARYLNGTSKAMTKSEAQIISAAGLNIVSLYEWDGNLSSFTANTGTSDANDAITKAILVGQPGNTPIYFCIDRNATPAEMNSNIVPYVQAILAVLGSPSINRYNYKLGIYGSPYVCNYIRGPYAATERYMFATFNGWTDSNPPFTAWNLKQYGWNQNLPNYSPSFGVDLVESASIGGGGWKL